MRAWQITGVGAPVDVLRMVDIPEPVAGPGEVLLLVHAAGVGMPDAFMCRSTYAFSPPMPFVPGQEMCGTVVAVGEGATARVGDRLMGVTSFYDGRGGLAEYTIANDATLFRVPEEMSSSDAATFRIGYSTALIGLRRRGQIQVGETVVVLGASGGSGSTAVQLAAALGARVLAVVSTPEKAALSLTLGASAVIDRSVVDVASAVNEMTDGRGADLVYDPVGGDLANATLKCLAPGGRLLAVGFASGEWANPPIAELVRRIALQRRKTAVVCSRSVVRAWCRRSSGRR
ncbi:MAG: NADPH:quinone oxidoreductase family protein [Actinobacteria bacterium]|nr:NADPH:quinone oxidoreductase family protein [Actinomycetota bacterium]